MPYRLPNTFESTPVASAARTASGNSGTLDWPSGLDSYSCILDVTAASGTAPTLDVALEISPDGGTTFYVWQVFTRATAASKRRLTFRSGLEFSGAAVEEALPAAGTASADNLPITTKYRWAWTIGGTTPSFTFSISVLGRWPIAGY